jgi:hypothetical protein
MLWSIAFTSKLSNPLLIPRKVPRIPREVRILGAIVVRFGNLFERTERRLKTEATKITRQKDIVSGSTSWKIEITITSYQEE